MIAKFLTSPRGAADAPGLAGRLGLAGGLGLADEQVGLVYGTIGVAALVVGGILGGILVSRFGLRRCLLPMALCMHAPNLLYAWAAAAQPRMPGIVLVVAVEQLGYGLGFTAYMTALLALSRGTRHSTTHYAISTGLMALSAWIVGRYSGDLVELVGFERFFWIVSGAGFLGLATLPLVPRESSALPAGDAG
jgi:PAT family beta-lactamase induction signal transducer AmpG